MVGFWESIQSITVVYFITVLVVYKISIIHDRRLGLSVNFSLKQKFYVYVLIVLVWGALILPVLKRYW